MDLVRTHSNTVKSGEESCIGNYMMRRDDGECK